MPSQEHSFLKYKKLQNRQYRSEFSNYVQMKRADVNPVYQVMKTQKLISSVFGSFLKTTTKSKLLTKSQIKRVHTEPSNTNLSKTNLIRQAEVRQARNKIQKFSNRIKSFQQHMNKSKKKFYILQRYNRRTTQYEDSLPKSIEQTRQSIKEDKLLLDICKEQVVVGKTAQEITREADKILKFKQPEIDQRHRHQFQLLRKRRKKHIILRGNK